MQDWGDKRLTQKKSGRWKVIRFLVYTSRSRKIPEVYDKGDGLDKKKGEQYTGVERLIKPKYKDCLTIIFIVGKVNEP